MDANGQVYFGSLGDLLDEDIERFKQVLREEVEANLRRAQEEATLRDPKALTLVSGITS